MEWISRVVGGWNVRMTVRGKRHSRFFADRKFGGKRAALAVAKGYRDQLVAQRPAKQLRPRPLVVDRGGSTWVQIRLPKPGGGTTTTEFSVRRHGARRARQLALEAWRASTQAR